MSILYDVFRKRLRMCFPAPLKYLIEDFSFRQCKGSELKDCKRVARKKSFTMIYRHFNILPKSGKEN